MSGRIEPLGRHRGRIARQHLVGVDAVHRHLAGEAFRDRDLVGDGLAAGDEGHHLGHCRTLGEGIFTSLQRGALARQLRHERENAAVGDDAVLLQHIADLGDGLPGIDHEHLVFGERTRSGIFGIGIKTDSARGVTPPSKMRKVHSNTRDTADRRCLPRRGPGTFTLGCGVCNLSPPGVRPRSGA